MVQGPEGPCSSHCVGVLELEAHAELDAAGRVDGGDFAEVGRGFDGVDAGGVLVVEDVEGSGGEAEAGRIVGFIGGEGEVVAPAQVEVDVGGRVLSVAARRRRGGC